MFVNEKELVEKLVLDLQERFGTQYIVRELRGGNNIADIVYTKDINRSNIVFDEYFNACPHRKQSRKLFTEKKSFFLPTGKEKTSSSLRLGHIQDVLLWVNGPLRRL